MCDADSRACTQAKQVMVEAVWTLIAVEGTHAIHDMGMSHL
jgi:hypothetical protein